MCVGLKLQSCTSTSPHSLFLHTTLLSAPPHAPYLPISLPAVSCHIGVMDEKVSATTVLGQYAEACPAAFTPFLEQALATLSTMVEYWHDEARAAAYDSLHKLVLAAHTAFPPTQHSTTTAAAGAGTTNNSSSSTSAASILEPVELSPQTKHVLGVALPLLTSPTAFDTSKVAVAAAAGALGHLLKQLGHGAVEWLHLEATVKMAQALLQGRAICQVGWCLWGFVLVCCARGDA